MNEDQKVKTYTSKLPMKTKLAIWLLVTFGVFHLIVTLVVFFCITDTGAPAPISEFVMLGLVSLWCIIPAIIFCLKNKFAWIFAVVILVIHQIYNTVLILITEELHDISITYLIVIFIPLTIIIFDRKNFLAMVRQRELDKKANPIPTIEP